MSRFESAVSFRLPPCFHEWWKAESARLRVWQQAYPTVFGERILLRVDDLIIQNLDNRRRGCPLLVSHPDWWEKYALIGRRGSEEYFAVDKEGAGVWRLTVGFEAVVERCHATLPEYAAELLKGLATPETRPSPELVDIARRTVCPPTVSGDFALVVYTEVWKDRLPDEFKSRMMQWKPDFEEHDLDKIKQFISLCNMSHVSWRSRQELAALLRTANEWLIRNRLLDWQAFVSKSTAQPEVDDEGVSSTADPAQAIRFDAVTAFDRICELMDKQGSYGATVAEPVDPSTPTVDFLALAAARPLLELPQPLPRSESVLRWRATTDPDEFALLAAVWRDPGVSGPLDSYAEWLEKTDSTAKLGVVRSIQATLSGTEAAKDLDDDGNCPWDDLSLVTTVGWLLRNDAVGLGKELLRYLRPTFVLAAEPFDDGMIALGASKFGGYPDLPPDLPWPACTHGPLGFLLQLRVRDLRGTILGALWGLPLEGLISLFAFQDGNTGYCLGGVERIPGDLKLVFTPAGIPLERRVGLPPSLSGFPPLPSALVAMRESVDLPSDASAVPGPNREGWTRLATALGSYVVDSFRGARDADEHHLGGYPVQSDDSFSQKPGYCHFLTLKSDEDMGWSWQEGKCLSLFVHEDDLKSATFTRVYAEAM